MELNGVQNQPTDDEQVPNGSLTTGSGSAHQDPDLTRPSSADSSQLHRAPSNQSSNASLSIEERLRRVRAAEKLKQQQRYAAYIEAQQQAEMARMRQQEERRRKIEEMRQKEQTRRLSALERRAALELSNQARIERLRERSANRSGNNTFRRRFTEHDHSGRTASASPSLGMSRNPSSLMTTSCVVAFGSSAPRSICTQPSAAALRLKQAFEARLASYLTGRHSGCFFTAAATPYYSCFIDPSHGPRPPTSVYKSRPSSRGVTQSRRAVSAHAYVLRQTKSSCTRVTHARRQQNSLTNKYTTFKSGRSLISKDSKSPNTATVPDGHNFESNQTSEVISSRSNSSNECDKIGRFNHHGKVVTKHSTVAANCSKIKEDTALLKNMVPPSDSTSSTRSSSVERRSRQPNISVFERLASMSRSVTTAGSASANKTNLAHSSVSTVHVAKRPGNIRESKRTGSSTMPPMMSKSVSGDALHQRHQKKPVLPSKPLSPTSYPTKIQEPETAISSHPQVPQSLSASESEINAKVAEVASTVTMPCNYSPTSPLSQVDTVKEETGVITTQLGPIKAETHGSGEGAVLKENEAAIYRAKLIEQRRLAKERMEEEQRRLEEENRIRRMQQEQARLAAEEETRLKVEQAAREAAEARLKEEQAAREAEEAQRAKEAEEVARAQAEEAERLEKLKRIEEERVLRKKKLDSIMSRVKRPVSTAKLGSEVVSESESAPNLQSTDITQLSSVPDTTCVSPDKVSHPEPSLDVQVPEIETKSSDTHTILNGRVTFTIDGEQENESSSSLEESVSQSPLSKTLIQKDLQNTVNNTFEDHVSSTTINGEEVKVTDLHSNQVDTDTETSLRISTTQSMSNSHSSVLKNNSSASHSTPLFKSALLQSMLGAGRLSTHAKDAVAGLRRNSSHVQDDQNKSDTWSQNTCHGDSPVSSFYSVNSTVIQDGDSVNINNSSSIMHSVRDTPRYYQHDLPHFNGSNGIQKSSTPIYLWSDGSNREASKPDSSLSSVPLDTSTH
ncbi:Ensconsin (Microtubule-associated protein 7) [Schistosoma japonicum]|nr:Ensconsin (Microtubule-associated protein 7) [Schistosoma japonicum]